ncbi:PorT family protein [Ginsengibacter hankyongi]|uniref:PorT family protein n=1 Tax=Ginsengibacter hankyongi TaxID=2607284 RepID=A0A5J5ILQ5_9BACT|nr:porin family protein [Ginsengibacter hankyongi]KAA9039577.1 PorT family protein [Ginsengibacter hankyongi]
MKSISLLMTLMILLTASLLSAQTKVGIQAGASFANVTIKAAGISISPKLKTGITAGLFLDVPLSENFGFQPALNFVQKGYEIKDGTVKDHVNLNYIEVPLNFVYNAGKSHGFFIGAGPSIALGLSGRDKYTDSDFPDDNSNDKVKFGSDTDELKQMDLGANAMAGYKSAGGFIISANYNLGFTDISNGDQTNPDEQGTIKNKYFSIRISFMFGGNKHK